MVRDARNQEDHRPWTAGEIASLRAWWAEGVVARVIGNRLGERSKASVVSKARSLKLTPRGNPIKRRPAGMPVPPVPPAAPVARGASTLPPLASLEAGP